MSLVGGGDFLVEAAEILVLLLRGEGETAGQFAGKDDLIGSGDWDLVMGDTRSGQEDLDVFSRRAFYGKSWRKMIVDLVADDPLP